MRNEATLKCRVCGCDQNNPCDPPCAPEPGDPTICSSCADAAETGALWWQGARNKNRKALWQEIERRVGLCRLDVNLTPKAVTYLRKTVRLAVGA